MAAAQQYFLLEVFCLKGDWRVGASSKLEILQHFPCQKKKTLHVSLDGVYFEVLVLIQSSMISVSSSSSPVCAAGAGASFAAFGATLFSIVT